MGFSETSLELFPADEKTMLLARIWAPERPKAVFLAIHGGMAHGGDWVTPALYFKDRGVATYALDLRWHGAYAEHNEGGKTLFHVDSYERCAEDIHGFHRWIRARHPDLPIFVLAHSNGSLIALRYALGIGADDDIRGFVVSSPWLKNRVKVPPLLQALSKLIAAVAPMLPMSGEPLTDVLTHDETITARHHADEASGLRGTKFTPKLGVEALKTQAWVLGHMNEWKRFPVFGVIAGQDRLADPDTSEAAFRRIPPELLHLEKYPDNYHENFNERNREEIYANIWTWMRPLLK